MTLSVDPVKSAQVLEEIKAEISKPGSILCLAKCVEIIKMLTDDVNPINLEELTEAILQDTFLTTKVLQYANSAQYNRSGKRISTVSQCVIILGLAVIRSIVMSVLLLEEYPNERRAEGIRNRGMISAFGGAMARTIGRKTRYPSPEHAFISSAFCQFGKLLVYSYLPERVAKYEKLLKDGVKEEEAVVEIFGMRLESLGKKIGEFLTLPISITCYMDPFELGSDDKKEVNYTVLEITHASFDVCNIVEKASTPHEMEESLLQCPSLRRTGINPADFVATFHECLDDVRQYYPPVPKGSSPDFWDKLEELSGEVRTRENLVQRAKLKGIGMEGDGPDLYVFTDGVSTVSSMLGGGTVRSVLAATCETLFLGFRARNVLILGKRYSNNTISGVVAFGSHSSTLEKVSFSMATPTHELHYAVLQSGKNIFISKSDFQKFLPNTPHWIKVTNPTSYLLLPIIQDGARLGLIYVDGSNLAPNPDIFMRVMAEIDKLRYYVGMKIHSQEIDWD